MTTEELCKAVIGLTEVEAQQLIIKNGSRYRLRHLNGRGILGTADYHTNRVNVSVEDGKVTNASIG